MFDRFEVAMDQCQFAIRAENVPMLRRAIRSAIDSEQSFKRTHLIETVLMAAAVAFGYSVVIEDVRAGLGVYGPYFLGVATTANLFMTVLLFRSSRVILGIMRARIGHMMLRRSMLEDSQRRLRHLSGPHVADASPLEQEPSSDTPFYRRDAQ